MGKYFAPLGIFVGGQILLLILWLFLPSIGDAGTAASLNEHVDTFWGFEWVSTGIKIIVVIFAEMLILFATWKSFLSSKS